MITKHATLTALAVFAASVPAHATVTISTAATQNMTCTSGICAPTAKSAVLNITDLENLLSSGNLTVTTAGSGVDARDMRIETALGWATTALDLTASHSIAINQPVSIQGEGGLSLTTGHKKEPGGSLFFGSQGNVTFADLQSSFSANGVKYTLVDSIASLASAVLANPNGNYALANSYDASGDGTYSAPPVPTKFGGIFEGLGNIISNLAIDDSADPAVGLFAGVSGGTLRDVSLADASVLANASSPAVGALAGYIEGNLINDSVSGMIGSGSEQPYIGGIVGSAVQGTITGCSSSATVSAFGLYGVAGGIVGELEYVFVFSNSRATGNVSGYSAGGLLGGAVESQVTTSFATGTVEGSESGGLAGAVGSSAIANSYATGRTGTPDHRSGSGGGLIGSLDSGSIVSESYSAGRVRGGGYESAGGFAGIEIDSSLSSDFWDTTSSQKKRGVGNEKNVPGVTGLTTDQLQSGLPSGFDPKIWAENPNINNGLPYLIANPPPK